MGDFCRAIQDLTGDIQTVADVRGKFESVKRLLDRHLNIRYNFWEELTHLKQQNGGIFVKKALRYLSLLCMAAIMLFVVAGCNNKDKVAEQPAADKTYVIYSDNGFAPFEYMDLATKTYVGLDMDLLAAIAEDQGFQYEMKNEGFKAAMAAVQSGQADAMIAGMTINAERMETFDFSEGYFVDGQIMTVAAGSDIKTLEDLRGKVVATKASTLGFEYANSIKDEYGFTLQVYDDSPTMYTAVMQGNNVACFEDRTVVEWAIKSEGLALETVGDVINPKDYGFAVKKGQNPELIEKFNAGLAKLKENGKYDEILAKYGY